MKKAIENVSKGEFIRFKENGPVYVKGAYTTLGYKRGEGRYECTASDDANKWRNVKKGTEVFVNFEF